MPGRGTPHAGIRVPAELWEEFLRAAREQGTDRSTLIRAFIAWYLRKPDATLPRRP